MMKKGAIISKCKNYRYQLWRIWNENKKPVMFLMLNPSTADADKDDPTIRRCMAFAHAWGYGGIYVGNLCAYRSRHPEHLLAVKDPFGPDNNMHLLKMSEKTALVVCAWGNTKIINKLFDRKGPYWLLVNNGLIPYCIELSKDGTPKHPLYLKGDSKLNIIPDENYL